jgi:capsular exopolysaccharide synthesis family protein
VTSALPNEGKTTTAVSLARIAAMAGSNVVLVDCDLRRRSATNGLGLQVDQGLTEVLFKSCTLEEALQMDEESGCAVLPLAQAEFTPRDLFGSQAMRQLLDTLRARYDMVILDSAPVIPIADTRVLAGLSDAVILVVRWGKTPAHALRQAVNRLTTHGGQIVGVVLSGTEQNLVSRLIYDKREYGGDLYSSYYIN